MAGGVDIATLGMRVDARDFVRADEAMDRFAQTGRKAEEAAHGVRRATETAGEASARRTAEMAREAQQVSARQEAFARDAEAQRRVAEDVRLATQAYQENALSLEDYRVAIEHARAEADRMRVAGGGALATDISRAEIAITLASQATDEWAESLKKLSDEGDLSESNLVGHALAVAQARDAHAQAATAVEGTAAASRSAGVGMGRLNMTMASLLRQATGTHPAVGQLANVVGSFAVGSAMMVGVLGGLAALGIAWRKISEDARDARKEQEDALDALQRIQERRRVEALGPGGVEREQIGAQVDRVRSLASEMARLEEQLQEARLSSLDAAEREFAERERMFIERRLERVREEFVTIAAAIDAGSAEESDARARAAEREAAEEERRNREAQARAEERARIVASSTEVVEALRIQAAEEARLLEARGQGSDVLRQVQDDIAEEQALRRALAGTIAEHRDEAASLVAQLMELTRANRDAAEAAQAEAEARKEADERTKAYRERLTSTTEALKLETDQVRRWIEAEAAGEQATRDLANELERERIERELLAGLTDEEAAAKKDEVDGIMALIEALQELRDARTDAERERDEAEKARIAAEEEAIRRAKQLEDNLVRAAENIASAFGETTGRIASMGAALLSGRKLAVPGIVAGLVEGAVNSRRDRAAEVEAARAEFERVLDAYVDELADRSRWERLERDARAGAETALDALIDSIVAGFNRHVQGDVRAELENARGTADFEEFLAHFGPEGQAILDAYREHLEAIEAQRVKEMSNLMDNLQIRELAAHGYTAEAEAMRQRLKDEEELRQAYELGGEAARDYAKSVQEAEAADRERARREREEDEARRQATFSGQVDADLDAREAGLFGTDREAFIADQQAMRNAEEARVAELLRTGRITEEQAERWNRIIAEDFVRSLDEFDEAARRAAEAAREAAEAERFRAEQDMQRLEVRLLRAQGLDEEAHQLQALMEIEQAMFDGRSAQYIQLLQMVHAEEARMRAMQAQEKAAQDATRALTGMTSGINMTRDFRLSLRRHQSELAGSGLAGDPFFGVGSSSPQFSGGNTSSSSTVNNNSTVIQEIHIHPAPGDDGEEILAKIRYAVNQEQRRGGAGNPVNPPGHGIP